jgi:hypothetical protein
MLQDDIRRGRQAAVSGMKLLGAEVQADYREVVGAALGPKMPKRIKTKLYANGGIDPAVVIYPQPGAAKIVDAFDRGVTIRPINGGRYLCIPTGYNKTLGRRMQSGGVKVTPRQMVSFGSGWTFTRPTKDGRGLVWFLKVAEAQSRSRNGRIKRRAFAGGGSLPGGVDLGAGGLGLEVGSGRRSRVDPILKFGAVPMFILLPSVMLRKRFDIATVGARHADRAATLVIEEWERLEAEA